MQRMDPVTGLEVKRGKRFLTEKRRQGELENCFMAEKNDCEDAGFFLGPSCR